MAEQETVTFGRNYDHVVAKGRHTVLFRAGHSGPIDADIAKAARAAGALLADGETYHAPQASRPQPLLLPANPEFIGADPEPDPEPEAPEPEAPAPEAPAPEVSELPPEAPEA